MWQLQHLLGLDDAGGAWYLWWSGACGNLALIAGAWSMIRKYNCHQHSCWRVGRHPTTEGYHLCRRHHPDGGYTP